MTETFKNGIPAWIVTKKSFVLDPVQKKYKITLLERVVADATGHTVSAVFVWKRRTCKINSYGEVFSNGRLIAENFKVELTAKMKRERYIEAECRRACDPNSERYWAM